MSRGGARRGAGRKPALAVKRETVTLYLDPQTIGAIRERRDQYGSLGAVVEAAVDLLVQKK